MFQFGLIAVIILVALISSLYFYLTRHFDHWLQRGIPGPKPKLLKGTFPSNITGKRNLLYDFDDIYRTFKNQTKFVGVFTTRNPQILAIDPSTANEILINNFKCFQDNESSKWMNREVEPISSGNPFALTGDDWRIKRAELVPGVTSSKVKGMYVIVREIAAKLINYLKAELLEGNRTFDAKDFSLRFTGEVVADVVWGIEAETFNKDLKNKDCLFLSMSKAMIAQTFKAFSYFFILGIFPTLRRLVTVRFFPEFTDRYFLNLTKAAINMRNSTSSTITRQDFLQHLVDLQKKKQLTDTEVVAHMLTFHFDGFETSAALISHCLLLLGRHLDVQQELRHEIMANIDADGIVAYDDLMKLPLLEQCVCETLRIFTPVPFMSKICTQTCVLQNNDGVRLQMQKGDICLISVYSFHHDEDYYPQPESFVPERFSLENGGARKYQDMGVYLPFGNGPRKCLGMTFGLAQAKAAIVEVIKNFEVTVNEKTRSDNWQGSFGFITGLDGGIYLNLKPYQA